MGKDEKSKNNSYWQLVVFSVLVSDYLDVGFIFNSLFDVRRRSLRYLDVRRSQCLMSKSPCTHLSGRSSFPLKVVLEKVPCPERV